MRCVCGLVNCGGTEFERLNAEVLERVRTIECRDKTQLEGLRKLIAALQKELTVIESFDRSGVSH